MRLDWKILLTLALSLGCWSGEKSGDRDGGDKEDTGLGGFDLGPENGSIQSGENPSGIAEWRYLVGGAPADDEVPPSGAQLCEHLGMQGTLAVVEVTGDQVPLESTTCEGPYSRPASSVALSVLANVHGAPIPADVDAVKLGFTWHIGLSPQPGKQYLATLREDAGEWFWLVGIEIAVGEDGEDLLVDGTDLPHSFSELVRVANDSPAKYCNGESIETAWGWPDMVRDPTLFRDCPVHQDEEPIDNYPPRDGG